MRAYLCKYPGCTHMVDTPRTYCKQHAALGRAAEMRMAERAIAPWDMRRDDAQVVAVVASKRYEAENREIGAVIKVTALEAEKMPQIKNGGV